MSCAHELLAFRSDKTNTEVDDLTFVLRVSPAPHTRIEAPDLAQRTLNKLGWRHRSGFCGLDRRCTQTLCDGAFDHAGKILFVEGANCFAFRRDSRWLRSSGVADMPTRGCAVDERLPSLV